MGLFTSRRTRRNLSRLGALGVAVACVAMLNASSGQTLEDTLPEDPRFPGQGLPGYGQHPTTSQSTWMDPQATSLNYIGATKQWIRPPLLHTVGTSLPTATLNDPRCSGRLGEGILSRRDWLAAVVFLNTDVSPSAADRFGRTQEFTVRTAAFGSLPVEADVVLEQGRNSQNAVLPALLEQRSERFCHGRGPFPERPPNAGDNNTLLSRTALQGEVAVSVRRLRIDGVELELASRCVAAGARLSLSAPDYYAWNPETVDDDPRRETIMTTDFFNISQGGLLNGTIDVPPFTNCTTTAGDDLSTLLTASVSGDGNPVAIRSEGVPPEDGLNPSTDPKTQPCPWTGNCEARLPALEIPETEPVP